MIKYVLGFAFSIDRQNVVVIEKSHPDWQKGKFNGVGGKIDAEDASPLDAMYREFKEETGVLINRSEPSDFSNWQHFATMNGNDWECYCFRAFTNQVFQCNTQEEEKIYVFPVHNILDNRYIISNLKWLIQLALDEEPKLSIIDYSS